MLDSIYHMILKLLKITFSRKNVNKMHILRDVIIDVITLGYLICKPLVGYQFYCMSLYHSQARLM